MGRSERIAGLLDDIDRYLGVIAESFDAYDAVVKGETVQAGAKRRAKARDQCLHAFDCLLESCRGLAALHRNSLQLIEDDQNGKRLDVFLYLEEALPGTIEGHQLEAHRDLGLSKLRKRRLTTRLAFGLKR